MENIIIIAVLVLVVGGALAYIIKAKKSGQKCIGCPDAKTCSGSCASCGCCMKMARRGYTVADAPFA